LGSRDLAKTLPAVGALHPRIRPSRHSTLIVAGSESALFALDVLLAVGLLLSTASQLRSPGLPIGPGEVCLLIWVVLMLAREVTRLGPPLTPALSRLLAFWSLFVVAQCLGTMTGMMIGDRHDPELFLHDVVAYPLIAAVSCLSVVQPGAGPRLRRVAWLFVTLGSACLALQLIVAWGLVNSPLIDPWYWERMRGWSQLPAQLALLCIVLGLVSLHLADTAGRPGAKIVAVACAILPIYVGRLTQADTFSLVLVASGPIFVAFKLRLWMFSTGHKLTLRSTAAWMILLGAPLLLVSMIPLGSEIAMHAGSLAKELTKNGGKDAGQETQLRFQVWGQAIDRGFEAGMLGLGPGPHLEIPPVLLAGRRGENEPKNIEHPEPNSTPNFEAHNTFLDLFLQGGLLADLSFVWLLATSFSNTYRARAAWLTTLLAGLCIYGFFTLIIRHPVFWFGISLCQVACAEAVASPTVRATARFGWARQGSPDRIGLARIDR
jgi:hypothetical protein